MATARFELDGLTVEGFKAFSVRQDVRFAGKHCFLFGANNLGKSSIIEAIRWCLFGSEPGSSVRNRFHEGSDCRVELRLRDEAGLWRLERRMRPGDQDTSLDTNLTIRNPDGERVASKETLLPNLARLGTRAGALVLFSAQQETRARAYGDLSRFQEVLYAHLGLTEAERFCDQLSALLEEQTEIERKRSEALEEAKRELGERLTRAETDLAAALRTPPWELSEAPTRSASTTRIQAFVSDLAHELGAAPPQPQRLSKRWPKLRSGFAIPRPLAKRPWTIRQKWQKKSMTAYLRGSLRFGSNVSGRKLRGAGPIP